MKFSMIPIIFAVQLFGTLYAARIAAQRRILRRPGWVYGIMVLLTLWGGVSTWLGLRGFYETQEFLASYPLFWFTMVAVVLVLTPYLLFARAREALHQLIDAVPIHWLIGIHSLRILAVGTMVKAAYGEFPVSFAFYIGGPDFLFGLSSLWVWRLARKETINDFWIAAWNIIGFLVIIPGAMFVAQRRLPGVFFSIVETPPMALLFDMPMALAPSLVVPIFLIMNVFVAIRLLTRESRSIPYTRKNQHYRTPARSLVKGQILNRELI
ncbi:MAG: hypothetical protein COB53_02910 [Elusimicrobia bacterium]|nr:MAG: hypothetical protein COB53_02910 [Elusimicrobiota bacterium]